MKSFQNKPNFWDAFWLSIFVIFITGQPFFMRHEIIMMETGIHLPDINAIFHGQIPYRDFFYLRGPLELYFPAFLMILFGKNMIFLPVFFYVWSVVTLIVLVVIAKNLYRSRLILYLMVPVLAARTFPRIPYYYWGGMRYALAF